MLQIEIKCITNTHIVIFQFSPRNNEWDISSLNKIIDSFLRSQFDDTLVINIIIVKKEIK